ncbi:MAG: C1 family peptidase [bacterium]
MRKGRFNVAKATLAGFVSLFFIGRLFAANDITRPDGSTDITKLNTLLKQKGAGWVAGENQFSKMTSEERKSYLGTLTSNEQIPEKEVKQVKTLPAYFNWKNKNGVNWMSPVKDQKSCGSCWAFSAVGVVEALINIGENNPTLNYDLSEQTLVTCSGAGSCGGGYVDKALSFIQSTGLPLESCDPYTAADDGCSRCADWASQVKKISGYKSVSGANIKTVLLENPLSVTMQVYEDFWYYSGGIYSYQYGGAAGQHAVVVIGWDDANSCWIAKNSWGTGWGEGGFFRIAYANDAGFPGSPLDADYALVALTAPNGGETIIKGDTYIIKWFNVTGDVKIDLYKGGVFNSTIVSSVSNTGVYSWVVPTSLGTGADYKIRVSRVSNASVYDESDNYFTITVPNVVVTTPNGGESWVAGSPYTIKWTSVGVSSVNISLYKGGVLNSNIASNVGSTGSYYWNIPASQALGTDYKIRITSTTNSSILDESNSYFSVTGPALTVTTPNGGENWATGSTCAIKWSTSGVSGNVKIDLYKAGVLNKTIISSTSNSGTYNWAIPTTQTLGTDYKVRVTSVSNTSIWDESNSNFIISVPNITVVTPNGGENWTQGSVNAIKWSTAGVTGNIKIELYKAGVFKLSITGSTGNTGTYNWTIPTAQAIGADYKIKITSVSNTAISDQSNNNFSISAPTITVVTPNGGESWTRGTVNAVKWTTVGLSGYVKIDLYKAGVFKNTIINSVSNTGTYNWTIPTAQVVGADYKIKITSSSNTTVSDQSNNNFSIVAAAKANMPKVISEYKLYQSSPNPAKGQVLISYQVPVKTSVSLKIYDRSGRLVKTLINEEKTMGYYEVNWNRKDDAGNVLPQGVYLYRLETKGFRTAKELIL